MTEIKKPKFPYILACYAIAKPNDILYKRAIVYNETDDRNFRSKMPTKGMYIVQEKLSKDDINQLPFLKRILYKTPNWIFVTLSILALLIATIIKYKDELLTLIQSK
jgi:hypothetical protein